MKKLLYFMLAITMLATFGCTGDESSFSSSIGSPNPDTLMPTGTVQGILKDVCTNEPIAGAVIDIGVAKATTSATGQYVMKKVPATSYVSPTVAGTVGLSGYTGNYSVTIDLRNAKNAVTGKNNYPQFAYDEVEVAFSSLAETALLKKDDVSLGLSVSTTNDTNHDTPVVGLGNGDQDFYVGQVTTSISGIAVNPDLTSVPNGYTVKLYSLGSHWDGNTSTGAQGHLIKTTTTKTINGVEGRFEFASLEASQPYMIEVIDTDTDVPTKIGREFKRTKCEGTTWFGVQDGDPVIVRSTDEMCPFVTAISPVDWSDLDPAVEGGINVTFTFSEPIAATDHNTGRGLTASDLGGLYQDIYVNYEGNKADFKAGNIAHTISWNATMTVLTVNIPVVGKASVYSVSLGAGAAAKLADAAGNALHAGVNCDNFSTFYDAHGVTGLAGLPLILQVHFTTYGSAAAGIPAVQLVNAPYDYDDDIAFSWTETAGAKYYNLYCAVNQVWGDTVNTHPSVKVNSSPIYSTTAAYDPNVSPFNFVENYAIKLTHTCYVVGVDADGLEGPASNVVTASDTVAPRIVGSTVAAAIGANENVFTVTFREPMVKSEIQNTANWTLNPAAFISGVVPTITSVVYDEYTFVATVTLSADLENIEMGSISTGPNGIAESTAVDTDDQVIQLGWGAPNTPCVTSTASHTVVTATSTDDNQRILVGETAEAGQVIIDSGGNGICETVAGANEEQTIEEGVVLTAVPGATLGNGLANQVEITAGVGFVLNATPEGDDTLANAPVFVTVSGVHDVAGNALNTSYDAVGTDGLIQ
jgi:hypothetical protein